MIDCYALQCKSIPCYDGQPQCLALPLTVLPPLACADKLTICRGNGFYPGTGEVDDSGKGAGTGFNLNIPWHRGGVNDADYIAAFDLVQPSPFT